MKRLVIAALAIGAMASCTKSNVQYEQPREISLQPVTQKATKAAIAGAGYPEGGHFKVWAWWDDSAPSSSPNYVDYAAFPYIVAGEFAYIDDNWVGCDPQNGKHAPYYWPTSGSLVFAGYSPAEAIDGQTANFSYNIATQTFKVENYIQSNNISLTKDLMWADVSESYLGNGETGIPLTFKHALSWLTFQFKLKDESTPEFWKIKEVKLVGIENEATFEAVKGGTIESPNPTIKWTKPTNSQNSEEDFIVYNKSDFPINSTEQVLENVSNGVVIIPQSCSFTDKNKYEAALVIEYDLKTPASSKEDTKYIPQSVTLSLEHGTDGKAWEIGKHYLYTITFGGNEILISPTVTDWTKPDVNQNIQVQ